MKRRPKRTQDGGGGGCGENEEDKPGEGSEGCWRKDAALDRAAHRDDGGSGGGGDATSTRRRTTTLGHEHPEGRWRTTISVNDHDRADQADLATVVCPRAQSTTWSP